MSNPNKRKKITCPSCGHHADDHKKTTLYRKNEYTPAKHVEIKERPEGVCSLSRKFIKMMIKGRPLSLA